MKKIISFLMALFVIANIIVFSINPIALDRQYEVSISSDNSPHTEFYLNPSNQTEFLFIAEHSLSLFFPSEFPFTDNITPIHVSCFIELPYKPPLVI